MKPLKRIESTSVTKVGWRKIVTKSFIMPKSNKVQFDTMHPDGQAFVHVIALTPDRLVVIVR